MLVNVYVDGFNLYYGCLKGTPYKWLDLDALARALLPGHEINRIRYFTARITERPNNPDSPNRQEFYLRALGTFTHLSIHFGRFQETKTRMRLAHPQEGGPITAEVIKTEEKGSDVNLATYLLTDAFRGDCELSIVISNDADLAEPIRLMCHELGYPVGIINPHRPYRRSADLAAANPTFFRQIRERTLRRCQLPEKLPDGDEVIRKPARW